MDTSSPCSSQPWHLAQLLTSLYVSWVLLGCPAGKSSVLQAILGKMTAAQGSVQVGGSIAYVPQTPWVQNLTLRENILFGLEFDEAKYNAVIHAAALELDLKILPKGECSDGRVTPSDSVVKYASQLLKNDVWRTPAILDLVGGLSCPVAACCCYA